MKKQTNRDVICKILNRKKSYPVSVYIEHIINKLGRVYNENDIVVTLQRMKREGKIRFTMKGKMVYGRVLATAFL